MATAVSFSSIETLFENCQWKASRYIRTTVAEDGSLLVYSSSAGAIARVSVTDKQTVTDAIANGFDGTPNGPLAELTLNGFFVPAEMDELQVASLARERESKRTDVLELSLLPTEKCNFRCLYCYESFERGKMGRAVIEGTTAYVTRRSASLASLTVGWFGGEPLTASDVVLELTDRLQRICHASGTKYFSSMVTNGYLLDPVMADRLIGAGIRDYQITIDGSEEDHNRLRVLADKTSGTFDRVFANLLALKKRTDIFRVILRLNFDSESARRAELFIDRLSAEFDNDDRFFADFHPIGCWGGPNDANLPVCGIPEGQSYQSRFFESAGRKGLNIRALRQRLEPNGSVCYAANPNSFVIGSDGTVYKCTVAFDDPTNKVGKITEDGELLIDDAKFAMWTRSGAEAAASCQSCFFMPSCHGNACPLERIRSARQPCPSSKVTIDENIRLIAEDAMRRNGKRPVLRSPEGLVQIST